MKKCIRCGKYYIEPESIGKKSVRHVLANDGLELCDKCYHEFMSWLSEKPMRESEVAV